VRLLLLSFVVTVSLFFIETDLLFDNEILFFFMCLVIVSLVVALIQLVWNVLSIIIPLTTSLFGLTYSMVKRGNTKRHAKTVRHLTKEYFRRVIKNIAYLSFPFVVVFFIGIVVFYSRGYRVQYVEMVRGCSSLESIEKIKRATVAVVNNPSLYDLDPNNETGHGTGVLISKQGYVLTAAHVISEVNEDQNISVMFPDGGVLPATGVLFDDQADVAVLKIEGDDYPGVYLGSATSSSMLFEPLYALGIPNHLSKFETEISAVDRLFSYTSSGVIKLETLGKIKHGYSGGPIFDVCGEVVGISINSRHVLLPKSYQEEIFITAISSETIRDRIKGKLEIE